MLTPQLPEEDRPAREDVHDGARPRRLDVLPVLGGQTHSLGGLPMKGAELSERPLVEYVPGCATEGAADDGADVRDGADGDAVLGEMLEGAGAKDGAGGDEDRAGALDGVPGDNDGVGSDAK